jgi:hypothetical protein
VASIGDWEFMKKVPKLIAVTSFVALSITPLHAQSLSPMRGQVKSFTHQFAIRVYPANPYNKQIKVEMKVYDQDFNPVNDARISPSEFKLGANAVRPVNVLVPFNGQKERKVRVCVESIPFPGKTSNIKAQICGKFLGIKSL